MEWNLRCHPGREGKEREGGVKERKEEKGREEGRKERKKERTKRKKSKEKKTSFSSKIFLTVASAQNIFKSLAIAGLRGSVGSFTQGRSIIS